MRRGSARNRSSRCAWRIAMKRPAILSLLWFTSWIVVAAPVCSTADRLPSNRPGPQPTASIPQPSAAVQKILDEAAQALRSGQWQEAMAAGEHALEVSRQIKDVV